MLQNQIIDEADSGIPVVTNPERIRSHVHRILVPVNGFKYSMDAADVAAYIPKATGAELVLFNVVHAGLDRAIPRTGGTL